MTHENENDSTAMMASIAAGLIAAGLSWYLLSNLLTNIPLIILAIFIFAVTAWGIYEAFSYSDGSSNSEGTYGEGAVNSTVSNMGKTDRDAWGGAGDASASSAPAALLAGAAVATAAVVSKKASSSKVAAKMPAAKKPAAKKPASKKPAAKTTKAPAKKAGPVRLKKPKGKADDLKLISGVGPKLEKTLNDLGFWHFSQIGDWKKADVEIVDNELSFKGRIDRDDWIKQAKKLAKQKT